MEEMDTETSVIVMKSSRCSVSQAVSISTASVSAISAPVSEISAPVPEILAPVATVPKISSSVSEISTPVAEISAPVTEISAPLPMISESLPEISTPVSKISASLPEISTPVAEISAPIPAISAPAPQISAPVTEMDFKEQTLADTVVSDTSKSDVAETSQNELMEISIETFKTENMSPYISEPDEEMSISDQKIATNISTAGEVFPGNVVVQGCNNSTTWYRLPTNVDISSMESTIPVSAESNQNVQQVPEYSSNKSSVGDQIVPRSTTETAQYISVEALNKLPTQDLQMTQNTQKNVAQVSEFTSLSAAPEQVFSIITPEGQKFEIKNNGGIKNMQPGVLYVIAPDQLRMPTKASKKAFIQEGESESQQILILPESNLQNAVDEQTAEKTYICRTCNESFVLYLDLVGHVMSAHTNSLEQSSLPTSSNQDLLEIYECSDCNLRFKKEEHLSEHIAMHFAMKAGAAAEGEGNKDMEGEEEANYSETSAVGGTTRITRSHDKNYSCDECDKKFTRAFSLKNHKLVHMDAKPFECDICKKGFREQAKLKNHLAVHSDEKPHICHVCAKSFAAAAYLRTHLMIHSGKKPYKCTECDKAFISTGNLKRHMRIHTGEKPFKCDFCGADFAQMGNLESHKRTHTGVRPYECDTCGRSFMQSSGLVEHMRTHSGIKPYSCDVCGRAFSGSSGLRVHKRTHTGEKPHECDICFKRFAASGNLKTHKKIHDNVRPFKCEYCGKGFVASGNLTQHLRIHTGERPHKCTMCDKNFSGTGGLKIHMMGHYDEKPFMCEYCDKGFKTKQKLTGHIRTHTGERPFSCDICEKRFSMREKLKLHIKAKHSSDIPETRTVAERKPLYPASYYDNLEPPVLSPQPVGRIHSPPPDPTETTTPNEVSSAESPSGTTEIVIQSNTTTNQVSSIPSVEPTASSVGVRSISSPTTDSQHAQIRRPRRNVTVKKN